MPKILVVEDEYDFGESIRDWLLLEGHKVDLICDGNETLEWLRFNDYDIILLDILLPNKNGIEICRRYRQNGGNARILMITARDNVRDKEYGLDAGADDYITKPFDLRELSARIRALMRRSLVVAGERLEVEDLIVDTMTHTVSRAGEKIELLPQEFALLEFLARQPNRIFNAERLIKQVWNGQSSTNTVRTHIKTLRRKIDKKGLKPLIKTVHGVGYTLHTE